MEGDVNQFILYINLAEYRQDFVYSGWGMYLFLRMIVFMQLWLDITDQVQKLLDRLLFAHLDIAVNLFNPLTRLLLDLDLHVTTGSEDLKRNKLQTLLHVYINGCYFHRSCLGTLE